MGHRRINILANNILCLLGAVLGAMLARIA